MTIPYLARNLVILRAEINGVWPNRDHGSDGWIGDLAHQLEVSDHNPDERGCVHAIDVDVDGIDPPTVVQHAIAHGSTEYVIWNRQIWERDNNFKPNDYTLADPHTGHIHVSGRHGATYENDTTPWGIGESDMFSDQETRDIAFTLLDGGQKQAIHYRLQVIEGQMLALLNAVAHPALSTPLTQAQINEAISANVAAIGASVASHIKVT